MFLSSVISFVLVFSTPMMDLLVQAASLNKLNPSGYSLVVLDSNQHVIHFKANQTVGQIGMYSLKEICSMNKNIDLFFNDFYYFFQLKTVIYLRQTVIRLLL
jgi:hypothetical protein